MGFHLDEMAVLYRTNNQSRVLEEKLVLNNIPYRLVGGTNFYARKEIRDIVSYLKVIANRNDDLALARIINVPKRGIGDTTVSRARDFAIAQGMDLYDALLIVEEIPGLQRAAAKIQDFTAQIESFQRTLEEDSLSALYDEILEKTGYKMLLEAEGTDEATTRLENLKELKNKIVKYEEEAEFPNLTELLEDIALVADADNNDEDAEKVTLMTLHSAKGLEFPYVHMVGMEERLFPSGMAIDSDDPDAVEEERRLCYVGITRAMKVLHLSSANTRMMNGNRIYSKVSRFIDEIPSNLLVRQGNPSPDRKRYEASDRSRAGGYGSSAAYSGYSAPSSFRSLSPQAQAAKAAGKAKPYGGITMSSPQISKGMPTQLTVDYAVGDTVKHLKFGKGTVTELVKTGSDYEVKVDFDRVGEKKMFASLAKLKKL
jgi:DNA helicase-2/ATP-dependent DNA helicase PcrA